MKLLTAKQWEALSMIDFAPASSPLSVWDFGSTTITCFARMG